MTKVYNFSAGPAVLPAEVLERECPVTMEGFGFMPDTGGAIVFASMNMLLGGVIILFVIFEPRGLVHRWNILKESFRISLNKIVLILPRWNNISSN